jgi:hypothetical protein
MLLRNNFSYLTENTFLAHHRHQSVNVVMEGNVYCENLKKHANIVRENADFFRCEVSWYI